jgi:predicted transcriptional regulator
MVTTTTPTTDLRGRRDQLGETRLEVAIRAKVSLAHLASLEGGLRPGASEALTRVEAALDALEAEQEATA